MASCPSKELGPRDYSETPITEYDTQKIEHMYKCTVDRTAYDQWLNEKCGVDSCITTRETEHYMSAKRCTKCVFPFTDKKGKTHTSCASKPLKNPWCATKIDENGVIKEGQWGYCNMDKCTDELTQACAVDSCITTKESKNACSKCVFPFTDKKGKTHTSCATKPLKNPWCATKTDENGVIEEGQWGFCDESKCPT